MRRKGERGTADQGRVLLLLLLLLLVLLTMGRRGNQDTVTQQDCRLDRQTRAWGENEGPEPAGIDTVRVRMVFGKQSCVCV